MALGSSTVSNMGNILKRIWPQDAVSELMFDEAPLFAMLPKDTSWTGQYREVVLQYGIGGGLSTSFSDAKAGKSPTTTGKMSVETHDLFAVWSVDHKLIALSKNDKGSLVRAMEGRTKAAMKKFKRGVSWMLYGDGGGSIGQVATSTTLASTSLVFRSAHSLRNVEIDDLLELSADNGVSASAGVRAGTPLRVTAVDPENLTVTVDANISTSIPTATTSDFVYLKGCYQGAFKGLEAWVPSSAPSTTIYGMARTAHPRRLGGIRVGGKGLLIQEAVKKMLKTMKDEGAKCSHVFMSTTDFLNLDLALGSAKRYADEKVGSVGFTGIEFVGGGAQPVKVFADPDCPANVIRGLQMDTWTFASAGEYPDFLDINGQRYHMEEATNSFEGRIGGYASLYTDAPGFNARLDLTAA